MVVQRKSSELLRSTGWLLALILLGQSCVEIDTAKEVSPSRSGSVSEDHDQALVDKASNIKDALVRNNSEIAKRRGEYQKSEAKSELAVAYRAQKSFRAEHGAYSNDPQVVFRSLLAEPRMTLHYVYGLKPSCSVGAEAPMRTLLEFQENPIAKETKESLRVIKDKLASLAIPCKPLKQGFTLVAIGMVRGADQLDIWSIDENKNLVPIQDGLR